MEFDDAPTGAHGDQTVPLRTVCHNALSVPTASTSTFPAPVTTRRGSLTARKLRLAHPDQVVLFAAIWHWVTTEPSPVRTAPPA
jgi:hypothetical protein